MRGLPVEIERRPKTTLFIPNTNEDMRAVCAHLARHGVNVSTAILYRARVSLPRMVGMRPESAGPRAVDLRACDEDIN